jgi:indolepyruvate ferredoxin oxidoreductase, beta subunit
MSALSGNASINVAILAMGGEGGGVLADWIIDLAESAGYRAQGTSVPGVAQRTGATIYYVEMLPLAAGAAEPVLALAPFPGDVDVVIASELMEAGRAIQRGLVTPERTTFIASTNRVYSMTEKTAMADGRVDAQRLLDSGKAAAKQWICADFSGAAEETGSVISAVLFGALCASGRLPFERAAFEAAIRRGGVGVEASLRAFEAGHKLAASGAPALQAPSHPSVAVGEKLRELNARILAEFPAPAHALLRAGIHRLADYQDVAYATQYLNSLGEIRNLEARAPDSAARLLSETARYLALWMSYEDTIRVADLKTRRSRFQRVREEVRLQPDQIVGIKEFLHPRVEEIADTLPAALGAWLLRTPWARSLAGRFTRKGRVVHTNSIRGFLLLYGIAALRPLRRASLRYREEHQRIAGWLACIRDTALADYDLAVAVAECQRLVKGYSDTHSRGLANFSTVMAVLPKLKNVPRAGELLRGLRDAALADDTGAKFASALEQAALKASGSLGAVTAMAE